MALQRGLLHLHLGIMDLISPQPLGYPEGGQSAGSYFGFRLRASCEKLEGKIVYESGC